MSRISGNHYFFIFIACFFYDSVNSFYKRTCCINVFIAFLCKFIVYFFTNSMRAYYSLFAILKIFLGIVVALVVFLLVLLVPDLARGYADSFDVLGTLQLGGGLALLFAALTLCRPIVSTTCPIGLQRS